MRVGILTFADTLNFGATLQAYALARALHALGHDAEVVDYDCPAVTRREHPRLSDPALWRPKTLVRYALERTALRDKRSTFATFDQQYVPLSPRRYTPADIADARSRYDVFVSGSDQIWNLALTGNDFSFFLDFEPDSTRKIAYAASFGSEPGTGGLQERMASALGAYGAIGVRERSGKDIVERLTGRSDVIVTVDPVLLLSRSEWSEVLPPEPARRPYLLLYFLHERTEALRSAKRLAVERGLEIVYLAERPSFCRGVQVVRGAGPREFVSLIEGAELVITGSFHATVFAASFNRPFICDTPRGGYNKRIDDFLAVTRLTERGRVDGEAMRAVWDQDWGAVNAILSGERERSLRFLRASLGEPGAGVRAHG